MDDFKTLVQLLVQHHAPLGNQQLVDIEVKKDLAFIATYWQNLCSGKENGVANRVKPAKTAKGSSASRMQKQRIVEALEKSKAGFAARVMPAREMLIAEGTYELVRSCEQLFGDKAALDARMRLREVRAEAGGRVSDEMVAALQSLDRPRRSGVPWSLHEDILLLGQIIACIENKEIDKISTILQVHDRDSTVTRDSESCNKRREKLRKMLAGRSELADEMCLFEIKDMKIIVREAHLPPESISVAGKVGQKSHSGPAW